MEINGIMFANAKQFARKLKVTVHSNGRLGFTDAAASELGLTKDSGIQLGRDDKGQMFLLHLKEATEESFRAMNSKDYYSINTAALFDDWGIDYANPNRKYVYDLVRVKEITNAEVYLMKRREEKKKRIKADSENVNVNVNVNPNENDDI